MKRLNVGNARALRAGQTDAERTLWRHLRDRHLLGRKFRRQHEIGPYIVDFVCAEAWLIVELDGGHHLEQAQRDARRTAWLQREGYRVLRFWNDEVLKDMDAVLERIVGVLDATSPHPAALSVFRTPPAHPCAGPQPPDGGFDPLPAREREQGSGNDDGFPPSPLRGEGRGEGA